MLSRSITGRIFMLGALAIFAACGGAEEECEGEQCDEFGPFGPHAALTTGDVAPNDVATTVHFAALSEFVTDEL